MPFSYCLHEANHVIDVHSPHRDSLHALNSKRAFNMNAYFQPVTSKKDFSVRKERLSRNNNSNLNNGGSIRNENLLLSNINERRLSFNSNEDIADGGNNTVRNSSGLSYMRNIKDGQDNSSQLTPCGCPLQYLEVYQVPTGYENFIISIAENIGQLEFHRIGESKVVLQYLKPDRITVLMQALRRIEYLNGIQMTPAVSQSTTAIIVEIPWRVIIKKDELVNKLSVFGALKFLKLESISSGGPQRAICIFESSTDAMIASSNSIQLGGVDVVPKTITVQHSYFCSLVCSESAVKYDHPSAQTQHQAIVDMSSFSYLPSNYPLGHQSQQIQMTQPTVHQIPHQAALLPRQSAFRTDVDSLFPGWKSSEDMNGHLPTFGSSGGFMHLGSTANSAPPSKNVGNATGILPNFNMQMQNMTLTPNVNNATNINNVMNMSFNKNAKLNTAGSRGSRGSKDYHIDQQEHDYFHSISRTGVRSGNRNSLPGRSRDELLTSNSNLGLNKRLSVNDDFSVSSRASRVTSDSYSGDERTGTKTVSTVDTVPSVDTVNYKHQSTDLDSCIDLLQKYTKDKGHNSSADSCSSVHSAKSSISSVSSSSPPISGHNKIHETHSGVSSVNSNYSVGNNLASDSNSNSNFTHSFNANDTKINLEAIESGLETRTTVMLRNIPNKLEFKDLKKVLDDTNKNTYDFLYLRFDFGNRCNVGYAFISFTEPRYVAQFVKAREGMKWSQYSCNSEKVADIKFARIQGRDCLIQKFRNSPVMHQDAAFRPRLYYTEGERAGTEEPFPAPGKPHN